MSRTFPSPLRRLCSDRLFQMTSWLFVAFIASSLFNYIFQVAMGRLLTPLEYGFLNALLAVCAVLGVPVSTMVMLLSRRTAEYKAQNKLAHIRGLFQRTNGAVLRAGFLGLVVFTLASHYIAGYLRSPSLVPILILGLCTFSSLAIPVNTAVLQGLQDYVWTGINIGLGGPVKFFFCVLLAWLGWGVNGVLIGLLATNVVLWLLAYLPTKKHVQAAAEEASVDPLSWTHMLPVFIANLAFAIMTQLDLVLVNRYFSSKDAALYASAAILGRSVMYIPGSLVLMMFPMASEQRALNLDSSALFLKSILMTVALSGAGAAIFFFFPYWSVTTLFGPRYADAAGILRYFGLAMLPMALVLVLSYYLIALEKNAFAYCMGLGAVLEVLLISLFHASLMWVIFILTAIGLALSCIGIIQAWTARLSYGIYVPEYS